MHRSLSRKLVLLPPLLLALAFLAAPGPAGAVTYVHEAQPEFEAQVAHHEIASATFNVQLRRLHVVLKDGRRFLYRYPRKTENALEAQLKAKGIAVAVLTPKQAKKEIVVHHKLRYIAGGILIAVIVVVGGVLLVNRRRKAALD